VSDKADREAKRDMNASPFCDIMQTLANNCDGFEAAVFFDTEGETIDYYSYYDPYITRLAAAHHGILFESLRHRLKWLEMGIVDTVEIFSPDLESITISITDDYCLTVMMRPGGNNDDLQEKIVPIIAMQRSEL